MSTLEDSIERHLPEVIELRRALHAYPEIGYEEHETSRRLLAELRKIPGLEIRSGVARTGIVATLGREKSGRCVALRADMDALPISEKTGLPWSSTRPGLMHACGHDGHSACLLGAAKVLSDLRSDLRGPVKFIFQPAEENGAGGKAMCDEGALDDPKVEAIFGLHGWPELRQGVAAVLPGPISASCTEFTIRIRGHGTHGASPHLGVDPIVVASHLVVGLQSIVSRSLDPMKNLVLTVGKIEAGTQSNIIPGEANMLGTIRAFDIESRELAISRVEAMAHGICRAYGAVADLLIEREYPPVINHPGTTAYMREVLEGALGAQMVTGDNVRSLGAEDFSYYLERIPGTFWCLGLCPPDKESYPSLHNPGFDFPDAAVGIGMRLHCETALRFESARV